MAGIRTTIRNEVTLDNASLQRVAGQISSQLRRSVSIDGRQFESISRPLGKITGQADEFTKSLEASNARVLAFGASVAIINGVSQAFSQLVENTIRVEKTLADINVVLGGTTKQLNQFKDAIFETAKNTAQSFDTVAEGALEFARQGLSMEESIKRINDALILTRLTGIDAATAVQGLTAAVNAFASEGLTTSEIINKLAAVDTAFAVSSEDLINSLSRASSVANDAGVSFDELIAITAALQETTARGGAVIGNALKSIFTRIQRPETLSSLQELGIAVQDLEGNILPATKLLEGLAGKVDQLNDLQRSQIFGEVAGLFQINQLIAAVTDLGSANSRTAKAIQISTSATDEAFRKNEQLNDTLSALLSQTGTGIEQLFSRIGEIGLTDDLKTIVGGFANVIEFLNKALSEDEGNKIAKGFIKGIGGAITSAPFLGLIAAIFLKLTASFVKFGIDGLKSFLGLNKAAKQQEALQASILNILLQEPAILKQLEVSTLSRKDKENLLLQVLKQQTAEYQKIATLAASITPGLYRAGARTGPKGVTAPTSAGGYIPAFAKENRDIAMGVGGAKPSDKSVLIPNFSFGRGKKGPMVANTGEYIVPNYAMGGDAIFNRDMVDKMGMPDGAMKINAAGGYIPNFAKYTFESLKSEIGKRGVNSKIASALRSGDITSAQADQLLGTIRGISDAKQAEQLKTREQRELQKEADTFRDSRAIMIVPSQYGGQLIPQYGIYSKKRVGFNVAGYDSLEQAKGRLLNDEEIEKKLKDYSLGLAFREARKIGGGLKPEKRQEVSNKGALSAMAGSIFESAIQSILNAPQFENNNATFDFVGTGYAKQLKKGLFPSIPSGIKYVDAKIRPSRENNESFAKKVLTVNNLISKKETEKSAALGYIPNFADKTKEKPSKKFKKNVGGDLSLASIANAGRSPGIAYNKYKKVNPEDYFERNNFKTDIIQPKEVGLNGWSIDKKNALLGNIVNSKGQPITNVKQYGEYFEEKVLNLPKYRSYKLAHEMYGGTNSAVDLVSKRAPLSFAEVKSGKAEDVRFKFYRAVSENIDNPKYGRRVRRLFKSETEELIKPDNILIKLGRSSSASGYIPNFAMSPLDDAIARERAAGVPINQIRINQSGKLRNSQNPMGLAVTNTRDEPTGAIPNFAKKSSSSDNPQLDQATGGALEKIFILQTVAAGLSQAFQSTADSVENVKGNLGAFGTEITSAILSLALLRSQSGGMSIKDTFLDIATDPKSSPGSQKAATSVFNFIDKFGSGLGKIGGKLSGVTKVFGYISTGGKVFARFLPAIGQAVFAFQALNAAFKYITGKGILQTIFDPFRDKTKLAAESLDKLSQSALNASNESPQALIESAKKSLAEAIEELTKGKPLTEEEKTQVSQEQETKSTINRLYGGLESFNINSTKEANTIKTAEKELQKLRIELNVINGLSNDNLSEAEKKLAKRIAGYDENDDIDISQTRKDTLVETISSKEGELKGLRLFNENLPEIEGIFANQSKILSEAGTDPESLDSFRTSYSKLLERLRNSFIRIASDENIDEEGLKFDLQSALSRLYQNIGINAKNILDEFSAASQTTQAEKRIFATDFARSIRELYFSANLDSEKTLFDKVSSIRERLANQTISETERFYLQRLEDEEEFNQKQKAARIQSQQKVIDAYLSDIQAVQTLPAETANKALTELKRIQKKFNAGDISFATAQEQAKTAVSTALGKDAPRENLRNAEQEAAQQNRTLEFEKQKFKAGQENQLIERKTREEREKSLRILTQQLDAQRRLNEASRDLTKARATSATEIEIERLKAQLSDPTLGEAARRTLELELSKAEIKLQGIQFEQNAIDTLRSQFTNAIQPSIDNLVENLETPFFNPKLGYEQLGDFAISFEDLGMDMGKASEKEKQEERNRLQTIFNTLLDEQIPKINSGETSLQEFVELAKKQLGIGELNTEELEKYIELQALSKEKQDAIIAAQLAAEKIRQREEDLAGQGKFFQIGLERAKRNLFQSEEDFRTEIAQKIPEAFASNMATALSEASRGAKSLKEALLDAAQSFLSMIQQAFMQRAVNQIVGSFLPGDTPTKKASGGYVSGGSGVRDDVPAMLMAGEYVIKKDAVNKYGVGFLSNLNQKAMPTMQDGGFYLPGMYGQGSLKGKDLEAFVNQRRTSGQYDKISGMGIDLEAQSNRLTTFGLTREDNPMLQSIIEAQNQGMDLLIQKEQYEAQQEEAFKEGLKQLGIQALSAVATYGITQGINYISNSMQAKKLVGQIPGLDWSTMDSSQKSFMRKFVSSSQYSQFKNSVSSGDFDNLTASQYEDKLNELMNSFSKSSWKKRANGGSSQSSANSMVMGGEFVMGRQAVQQYGKNYFDSINNMTAPAPRFAQGGLVGSDQQTSSVGRGGDTNITINVSSSGDSKTQSDSQSGNSQESDMTLAEKIKKEVVRVIEEEKRVSGSLSSRKRGV